MSYFPSSLSSPNPLDDLFAGYSYLYPELLSSLPTPPPLPKEEQDEEVVSEEILQKVGSSMPSPPPEFLSSQSSNIYHPYNDELMRVVTQPPVGLHNFAHYSRRVANAQAKLQMGKDSVGLIAPASIVEEKMMTKHKKKKKDEKKGGEREEEEEAVCVNEEGATNVNVGSFHLFPEELGHGCPISEHDQPHVRKGKKLVEQYGYSDGIISHPTLNGGASVDVSLTDGETEDLASLRVPLPRTRSRHSCNGTEESGKEVAGAASSSKRKRNHGDGASHDQTVTTGRPKRSRAADIHNESERRRRDRIKEKMRELQELIPNANKMDKASMLDEAIEYLKFLQAQIQMMSMRTGMGVASPMMFSMGMQHTQMPPMPQMGMGIGMGMMDASTMVHSFKGPNSSYMPNVFHPRPVPFSTSDTQYGLQSAMDNAVLQQQYILHLQNNFFQPQLLQANNPGNVAMKKF